MTHDELLAAVQFNKQTLESSDRNSEALRAVVELHKPDSNRMPFCQECRAVFQGQLDVVLYPCPTIKAIEKELS